MLATRSAKCCYRTYHCYNLIVCVREKECISKYVRARASVVCARGFTHFLDNVFVYEATSINKYNKAILISLHMAGEGHEEGHSRIDQQRRPFPRPSSQAAGQPYPRAPPSRCNEASLPHASTETVHAGLGIFDEL